jgi:hypothetical protein
MDNFKRSKKVSNLVKRVFGIVGVARATHHSWFSNLEVQIRIEGWQQKTADLYELERLLWRI